MTDPRVLVAARIERELPTVAAAAVTAIQDAVPAYRSLHGRQLADVEAIAYWSLVRLVELWTSGETFSETDQTRFRAIGAARAGDGRPLPDILRAYRVASSSFVRHVTEVYLDDLEPIDVAELSLLVLRAVDAISEEIIDAYTAERDRLTSDRGRARAAFLDDLLAGRHNSPGAIADRSRELALAVAAHPRLLVVERCETSTAVGDDDVTALVVALGLPDDRRTYLHTRQNGRGVVLLPDHPPRDAIDTVAATVGLRGCLLAGQPLADVGARHRLADDAVSTAPAHAFTCRALLDDGDAHLLALLTARPTADTDAVISAVLGPLRDAANHHLLEGVSAFISTGTATAAAASIHVHPQTLRYRLRRARELTGRDPREAWHRLALDTAIQLQQLSQSPKPPARSPRR